MVLWVGKWVCGSFRRWSLAGGSGSLGVGLDVYFTDPQLTQDSIQSHTNVITCSHMLLSTFKPAPLLVGALLPDYGYNVTQYFLL